jgi:hypothetical protein
MDSIMRDKEKGEVSARAIDWSKADGLPDWAPIATLILLLIVVFAIA